MDDNFEEDTDKPARVASEMFDAGSFTPGLATASNLKTEAGKHVDAQAASQEAHAKDIAAGLAIEPAPQRISDGFLEAPAVNLNQILAELVNANQRIATLEATAKEHKFIIKEQQKRLDEAVAGRAADVAADIADAHEKCNAVLMAVMHKYHRQ